MPAARHALTPDALVMIDTVARQGSFAGAARELGKVPSALTYSVRQLEDALDVLLFDRSSGQAQLTPAGDELLREGRRLLAEIDAVANRVRRVSCGWESQLSIAADGVISRLTLFELCEAFYALRPQASGSGARAGARSANGDARAKGEAKGHGKSAAGGESAADAAVAASGPGTRLRLRTEVLSGTTEALLSGQADLAIGIMGDTQLPAGIESLPLGQIEFVFAVAPHHPLAAADDPLTDAQLLQHRAVAVADSAARMSPLTVNLLPGQEVLTVASVQAKIDAQLRGLGCGFVALPLVRQHVNAGHLVLKEVARQRVLARFLYAWRAAAVPQPKQPPQGLALAWWLEQLERPATRTALIERHIGLQPVD